MLSLITISWYHNYPHKSSPTFSSSLMCQFCIEIEFPGRLWRHNCSGFTGGGTQHVLYEQRMSRRRMHQNCHPSTSFHTSFSGQLDTDGFPCYHGFQEQKYGMGGAGPLSKERRKPCRNYLSWTTNRRSEKSFGNMPNLTSLR